MVVTAWCPRCEEPTDLVYGVTRRFASLFLVPMVPLRRRHWLACVECTQGYRLGGAQRAVTESMAGITERARNGLIAADDYDRIAGAYIASGFTTVSPAPPDVVKTCRSCTAPVAPDAVRCPVCGEHCRPWSEACGLWLVSDDEGRTFASRETGGWERVRQGTGCPACGAELAPTTRRCESCGTASRAWPVAV